MQFVTEVDRLRLDITGSFTEVALEQSFYKAARDHNLVGQVEEADTFTKAKRKELQQTLHGNFVSRGKGTSWKLEGLEMLMG